MKQYHFKFELEGEIMSEETLNISLTVNSASQPFQLTDAEGNVLADGDDITLSPETVGVADPGQLICIASGGTAPYSVELESGALPVGDQIDETDNGDGSTSFSISGTPTAAGDNEFALTFSDSAGNAVTLKSKATSSKVAPKVAIRRR